MPGKKTKVRFKRDTGPYECQEPKYKGDITDLSDDSLARWLKRDAVEIVQEDAATKPKTSTEKKVKNDG